MCIHGLSVCVWCGVWACMFGVWCGLYGVCVCVCVCVTRLGSVSASLVFGEQL